MLLCAAAPGQTSPVFGKRVIYYYQTQYYNGNYVSLSPIWNQCHAHNGLPIVTDVMVAAFHLGYNNDGSPYIHLNDNPPGDPMFDVMWQEVATLQSSGVKVRIMLGGAAQGSYAVLFSDWDTFYPILKGTLQQYHLDGIDLDIEEQVSLSNAKKIVAQLNTDFGHDFIITMSPVASALWGGGNLSGFDYKQLYQSQEGKRINWFNGQFYSGFGTMASDYDYNLIVQYGFPPGKVVAGMIGNPADGGGFIPVRTASETVSSLAVQYPHFGGVASWEYFNTLPGGLADPVKWAAIMAKSMGNYPATCGTE